MLNKSAVLLLLLSTTDLSWAGAWGTGSFENDSALDWVGENITVTTSLDVVASTLDAVQTAKYVDVDDCSSAIAAAEIIASINLNKFDNLPENVASWAKRNKRYFNKSFVNEALESVNICSDSSKSELAQLWSGALYEEWKKNIDNVNAGLK